MAIKFRLKGLAETFIDEITCPYCGLKGADDSDFLTDLSKVTFAGIVVVAQCKACGEIFVPENQRLGIVNYSALKSAVIQDAEDTGDVVYENIANVRLSAEKLNQERKQPLI
ncbi:MAG: hypothetical protein ACOX3T_07905 [Bdellovibrionota bacterium]